MIEFAKCDFCDTHKRVFVSLSMVSSSRICGDCAKEARDALPLSPDTTFGEDHIAIVVDKSIPADKLAAG